MSMIRTTVVGGGATPLHVRKWPVDAPRARVLLVNGISDHAGRWSHVADFFTQHGFAAAAYDHRGHGRSGGPRIDASSFALLVEDFAAVVSEVREPELPLVVYAHSMGGLIATLYATSPQPQPDLYVLSAPALDAVVPAPLRLIVPFVARVAPSLRVSSTIRGDQLSKDPAVGEAYFADPLVFTNGTVRFGASFLGAMEEGRARADQIAVPTLVIHGSEDTLVPPSASAPLAASPVAERRLMPGLRHEMHNEPERAEVFGAVLDWLEGHLRAT